MTIVLNVEGFMKQKNSMTSDFLVTGTIMTPTKLIGFEKLYYRISYPPLSSVGLESSNNSICNVLVSIINFILFIIWLIFGIIFGVLWFVLLIVWFIVSMVSSILIGCCSCCSKKTATCIEDETDEFRRTYDVCGICD